MHLYLCTCNCAPQGAAVGAPASGSPPALSVTPGDLTAGGAGAADDDAALCVICLDAPKTHLLLPCVRTPVPCTPYPVACTLYHVP